jgi:hypothetical protein
VTPKQRRRAVAAAIGALLIVAAVVAALIMEGPRPGFPPRAADERPTLLLLTSLPIVFPSEVTLDSKPEPALAALRSRYALVPIGVADAKSLDGHRLLLMAQPQAQPAEDLVALDAWVRRGGRVLLLADPALEWPSNRPLGSMLRPPTAYPDTGLLAHWGLRLDAPDELAAKTVANIETRSPGVLVATEGDCSVEDAFIAHCLIGKGEATVIADADFINVSDRRSPNLTLLLRELNRLER